MTVFCFPRIFSQRFPMFMATKIISRKSWKHCVNDYQKWIQLEDEQNPWRLPNHPDWFKNPCTQGPEWAHSNVCSDIWFKKKAAFLFGDNRFSPLKKESQWRLIYNVKVSPFTYSYLKVMILNHGISVVSEHASL